MFRFLDSLANRLFLCVGRKSNWLTFFRFQDAGDAEFPRGIFLLKGGGSEREV